MGNREDPLNTIVKGIKEAGLDSACLYLIAFQFVNEKCFSKTDGIRCEHCPPKGDGPCHEKLPECVHEYLKKKIGIDIPAIQPRQKK